MPYIAYSTKNKREQTTYSVESVVYNMFEILTHSNLSHQLVFVSVHTSQLTNMSKCILYAISQL